MRVSASAGAILLVVLWSHGTGSADLLAAAPPIGGFIPLVGLGLTDEATDPDSLDALFFVASPSDTWDGEPLGPNNPPHFELALLDTGAATHILTPDAYLNFAIASEGFAGTYSQQIVTANGTIDLDINLPHGVYVGGLADGSSDGSTLTMDTDALRGQTSFATLSAPSGWSLPNLVGLPMAAQHAIAIKNSEPQIIELDGRTVRTPNVELNDLGSGGDGILRRAPLKLRPGADFVTGPVYIFTIDIGTFEFVPTSPTLIPNGGMYLDVDMANGTDSFQDREFLLDTGADLTILSEITAKRLGFDAVLDEPDFTLEVETPSGISGGVPGIYIDELNIDTVGGSFTLYNVPVAVLDVPNPSDPGNVIDGILGMNAFNGRDLVIDANPAVGGGGVGPSLYISDPVTDVHTWASTDETGLWTTPGDWSDPGSPTVMWDAQVHNVRGSDQQVDLQGASTVHRLSVGGDPEAEMTLELGPFSELTTFADVMIETGGTVLLQSTGPQSARLDAQVVNIDGGTLRGAGTIFVGTGPFNGAVRNLTGRVEPGGTPAASSPVGSLEIIGDFINQAEGTLAIDLGGTLAGDEYDLLDVGRSAFLDGILEVSLADLGGGLFEPSVGNTFEIITAGGDIFGTFDQFLLPAGYVWDHYVMGGSTFVLEVIGLAIEGDFNEDGVVDAADYTVWRNNKGLSVTLPNDPTPGVVDQSDYLVWRTNYGLGSGAGAGAGSTGVPEPTTLALLSLGTLVLINRRGRRERRGQPRLPQPGRRSRERH